MRMYNLISSKFTAFPEKREHVLAIFCIVLAAKAGSVWLLSHLTHCSSPEIKLGVFATASGDTFSYTGAMENLLSEGKYFFWNGQREVLAGRMPHYGVVYWIFRQFFSQPISYDLVVTVQLLLECLAITAGFLFVKKHFTQRSAALFLLFMLIDLSWTNYSYYISPESLSTSFLLFFCMSFSKYMEGKQHRSLLLASVSLALLTVLKPYFGILYLLLGLGFLTSITTIHGFYCKARMLTMQATIASIPLVILLTPWVIRNYVVLKKFIPLQENLTAGYNYTQADFAYRSFVQAWGGDFVFWEKTSAGCFFEPISGIDCEFVLPQRALSESYTIEDVYRVRDMFVEYKQSYDPILGEKVVTAFNDLERQYRENRPFDYYFVSRLILIKQFLTHSGSYFLPIHTSNPCFSFWQYSIKVLQSAVYWLSLTLGFISLLVLVKNKFHVAPFLLVPLLLVLLFPVILRAVEWRMFQGAIPLLLTGVSLTPVTVWSVFQTVNNKAK